MKVIGFYHICMINEWRTIVDQQINRIKKSGLLDLTQEINVACLGNKTLNLPKKYNIAFRSSDIALCEMPIINLIKNKSKTDDFYIWYIHTKGVFSKLERWRKYLEYFIIDKHLYCHNALNDGYDCCGVSWACDILSDNNYCCYFGGNFWWTKSSFVRNLPYITEEQIKKSRWIAEAWLGTGNPKIRSLYKINILRCGLPEKKDYTNHKILTNIKIL